MCSSKKSSTREEGRANAGSRPDAVATNSDDGDGSGDAFPVIFFAAGLSSCAVRIFATPGGVPTRLFTHWKQIPGYHGPQASAPSDCRRALFFPSKPRNPRERRYGRGVPRRRLRRHSAPRAFAMAPFARRRATLLTLALLLSSTARARAQPRGDPCTVARLVGLVDLCAPRDTTDASSASAPSPGDDACCAELSALNDARCFCREPFLTLPQRRQSALVPALANGPRRCGVNTRVGDRCLSVVRPEPSPPPPRPPPAPLSPTQPRPQPVPVPIPVPPPPGSPAQAPAPSTSPSPPPGTCAVSELVRFVQDGCAATLAAAAAASSASSASSSSSSASADGAPASCCDRLRAFNDAACFCLDETASTLRAFPANFRRAFGASPVACGAVVRGGWQCAPFPAEAAWTRGGEDARGTGTTRGRPFPPAPAYPPVPPFLGPRLPPSPPLPAPPPTDPSPTANGPAPSPDSDPGFDFDAFSALVCRPEALVSLAEQRCDRIAFATFASSGAGDACCERIGLLNSALCFCDPRLASLVDQLRDTLARTFAAAPGACGFAVYARMDGDDDASGDETTCRVAAVSAEVPPTPPTPPSLPIPPFPPFPPRPPRPRAPPPSSPPPPKAPSGPRGPPGPPGRDAAGFFSSASCPPWVRACRGNERGWGHLGTRWKGEDEVFPSKPRAPPGLEGGEAGS